MTIYLRRCLAILLPLLLLNACTSGVTSSKAGGAGTNTGTTGLTLFATLVPDNFSGNAFALKASDCGGLPPEGPEAFTILPTTDFGTLTVTVQDPSGIYLTQSEGITFDTYRLEYQPVNQGTPVPLPPRSYGLTFPIPMNGANSVTASIKVVLFDLETKNLYASKDSGSPNTYNITLTYQGRDFISGAPVTLVVTTQMELGAFCEESGNGGE